MKLISACLAFILLFFVVSPALADYNSAYSTYTANYSKYREAYSNYQIAKSTYGTYKTLTAQQEAISKLQLVLQSRDDLISSYYDLLATRVPANYQDTFSKISDSEKNWLSDHGKKISAASTLDDLNSASDEFENRYPQMDAETKQAIKAVLIAKENPLLSRWDTLAGQISDELKNISAAGENTGIGERGVITARNKKELAVAKMNEAQNTKATDLFGAQQKLTESLQYLREATGYLNEVLQGITGQ
ncbi:hypothetical protein M1403_00535 [Patescibacteria group bacterium]|nr:hypothetical protein [Patescibacteria group bacterium]